MAITWIAWLEDPLLPELPPRPTSPLLLPKPRIGKRHRLPHEIGQVGRWADRARTVTELETHGADGVSLKDNLQDTGFALLVRIVVHARMLEPFRGNR